MCVCVLAHAHRSKSCINDLTLSVSFSARRADSVVGLPTYPPSSVGGIEMQSVRGGGRSVGRSAVVDGPGSSLMRVCGCVCVCVSGTRNRVCIHFSSSVQSSRTNKSIHLRLIGIDVYYIERHCSTHARTHARAAVRECICRAGGRPPSKTSCEFGTMTRSLSLHLCTSTH